MSALVLDAVVREGRIAIVDSFYKARSEKACQAWGDGTALKVRVEPEEDAAVHGQFKHLFGHVFEPVAQLSGHTKTELCLMAKAQFMPDDGRTSLTQLNRQELDLFSMQTEDWLRAECPQAFERPRPERVA